METNQVVDLPSPVSEYFLQRFNLPKRYWGVEFADLEQKVRQRNTEYLRDWVLRWQKRGAHRMPLLFHGAQANEAVFYTLKSLIRKTHGELGIYCIHPGELALLEKQNPERKLDLFEVPLLCIYGFFEGSNYGWDLRSQVYNLIKHRWYNAKTTVYSCILPAERMAEYMVYREGVEKVFGEGELVTVDCSL